jgi:hypothetical protein
LPATSEKCESLLSQATRSPCQGRKRIELLHKAHKKHWHRYPPDDGLLKVYVIKQFASAAGELLNAARNEIRGPGPIE